jgi:isoleucyl-tRNA synthetase
MWRNLAATRDGQPESVHLADYPDTDDAVRDEELETAMAAAREIVSLGRTVRTEAKVRVRQPLQRAAVHLQGDPNAMDPLVDLIKDELNVKEVTFAESASRMSTWRAKPNFRTLGPRLGPRVKEVAAALHADDGSVAAALARGEPTSIETAGGPVELAPEDVDLAQETTGGWGVAHEGGLTVALELELTPELEREGLARELVRLVQDARKNAGLAVSDRIELAVDATGAVAEAVEAHSDWVGGETLAVAVRTGKLDGAAHEESKEIDGTPVGISLRKS